MNSDTIQQVELSGLTINKAFLWGAFGFSILICVIISTILTYHWHAYGMKNPKIVIAQTVYYAFTLLLIIGSIYFIITF